MVSGHALTIAACAAAMDRRWPGAENGRNMPSRPEHVRKKRRAGAQPALSRQIFPKSTSTSPDRPGRRQKPPPTPMPPFDIIGRTPEPKSRTSRPTPLISMSLRSILRIGALIPPPVLAGARLAALPRTGCPLGEGLATAGGSQSGVVGACCAMAAGATRASAPAASATPANLRSFTEIVIPSS